jgi:hypothetical protein
VRLFYILSLFLNSYFKVLTPVYIWIVNGLPRIFFTFSTMGNLLFHSICLPVSGHRC